jgi:hypothetical protein
VNEAARLLPDETELNALAAAATALSRPAINTALTSLEKNPDDAAAFASVLYGALAFRNDAALRAKALPLLTTDKSADSPLASARVLAKSLLAGPQTVDRQALAALVDSDVAGEDMTVLVAFACRRAGNETWNTFRAASHEVLGEQPLSGDVVVLVNRLAGIQFPSE